MKPTKITLRFALVNYWENSCRLECENTTAPIHKRLVSIELTEDQLAALDKRDLGVSRGKPVYEHLEFLFMEEETNNAD